jgi:hypothetical protein
MRWYNVKGIGCLARWVVYKEFDLDVKDTVIARVIRSPLNHSFLKDKAGKDIE